MRHFQLVHQACAVRAQLEAIETERLFAKVIYQVLNPEPGQEIKGFERKAVSETRMRLRDHVDEGMRKGARRTPGHRENNLERGVKCLRHVDVSLARRIRD